MATQIKEYGEENVLVVIRMAVEKCIIGLNISMADEQVVTLCEDILEKYEFDSLEDVKECLKKGRQGYYGFGHESRSALTMILITNWMGQHLEKKSQARESSLTIEKQKHLEATSEEIDYSKYKNRIKQEGVKFAEVRMKRIKKAQKEAQKEAGFERFKDEYLKNKSTNE